MTQSLARQQSQEMARPTKELSLQDVSEMTGFELPQIAMIRHNMALSMKVAPDSVPLYDIALYCHAARTLELDPLLRQCYWISRQGKGALQVGIDGYRAIAERSGVYAGSQAPEFRDWFEFTENNKKYLVPGLARVTVWKLIGGRSCAFTGEAYWQEWYPGAGGDGFMYRKMPRLMLAKDAEAQALRKAFPAMLSKVEYASGIGDGPDVGSPSVIEVQEQRPTPQPKTAQQNVEMYDRTIGAADWGERQPQRDTEPVAVEDEAPSDPSPVDGALVTSKTHPMWKRWLDAERAARAAGVSDELLAHAEGVRLGQITEVALEAACADLETAAKDAASNARPAQAELAS
jgi:hypothetical protein